MALLRGYAPSLAESCQSMTGKSSEPVNRLSSGVMRNQALCQLPTSEIAIVRIFHGVHGKAFPCPGGITFSSSVVGGLFVTSPKIGKRISYANRVKLRL